MKRLQYLAATFLTVLSLVLPLFVSHAEALSPNLISNPSMETVSSVNSSQPQDWVTEKWGTNSSTFTYQTTGHTGSRSVYTKIATYTNGDAKWYFNPVAVSPNTSYTFSDYFASNIASQVVVMAQSTTGALSYKTIKSVASSATWKQISATYVTPADVKTVTVFHLIKKVGWIQLDDAYFGLTNDTTVPTPPTISITAPVTGTTVSNSVTLNASATDTLGVAGVQFMVDGVNIGPEDTVAPYTIGWDTATASNGVHSISAVARNTQALTTTSTAVQVTVNNVTAPTAPTVSITSPVTNSTLSAAVSITANASDAVAVAGVQFKVDGVNVGAEDITSPYSVSWDTVSSSNTSHAITAVARNTQGLTTTSVPVTVTVSNVSPPLVDQDNLVVNPSVESSSNTTSPDKWLSSKWGTNTVNFTYDTVAHSGNKSVKTTVSSYTSGDAKWYFEPIAITPGKNYIYRDYYKSTITSRVVAAFIDSAGVYTYKELATAPTSGGWSLYESTISMPANATKVTVFHLLDGIGSLNIDDVLLQVAVPAPIDISVPNGSVENGTTTPTGWTGANWGTNTPTYTYVNGDAHTGTKSVKVAISNYSSGDAKWFFSPIKTLTPDSHYRFTTWYKGTVQAHVVALFIDSANVEHYVTLPSPLSISSTTWQQYSDTFTVPLGTTSVSVFMLIQENGWLQTDDYSIVDYHPVGFNRPLLSLTFDDGHEDNATNALPLLNQYGFKSTQCFATSFIEGQSQTVIDGVMAFVNSGHEICSHTVTHPFLTTLTSVNLNYELSHSKAYLEGLIGKPVLNFASPYGDYNATVNDAIKNYYQSHRTVDEGFNSKDNFDAYRLRVENILDTTTAAQVSDWIKLAQADNTWLILVYHRIANNPGPYDSYITTFQQHLQAISQSGITVATLQDALVEAKSQL